MDNNLDVTGLRTDAQNAGNDLTSLTSQAPGLLTDLRKSLVSIYNKDNPIIQARDTALGNYMGSGDQARSDFLASKQPMVAGSNLNYSPTELNAMVSGRQSAYLAPLLGLNQAVSQGYGNISDILQAANGGIQGQISAATAKASNALNLYKAAIEEYNAVTARQQAGIGSNFLSGFNGGGGGGENNGGWEIVPPAAPTNNNIDIPGQGTIAPYNPVPVTPAPYSGPTFNATPNNNGLSANGQSMNLLGGGNPNSLSLAF